MKVVVTGGAGFIGGNLCRLLSAASDIDEVIAVDDLSTGRSNNLDGSRATLVEASILETETLSDVFSGADAVVHLAARPSVPRSLADPVATHQVNATGTVNVLEAARRNRTPHVVVASSSSVYGATTELPKREDLPTRPLSPYAASKLATESYTLSYGHSFGVGALAFRFFNVFGPLQPADHAYAAVVPTFVAAALRGDALPVNGDGRQTRDFTYVGTVCAVIADAVRRRVTSPDPVNLAFGTRTSLLDLIARLEAVLEQPLRVAHGEPRAGDVRDSQADTKSLRALFPDVEPVGLDAGLRETVEWFRTAEDPVRGTRPADR